MVGVALLMVAGLLSLATAPADQPLSKDDITLLLLGSSPSGKIIQMVEQRGVDFQMNPDLAKKFHDQGASDDLIDALQKAGNKAAAAKVSAPAPASAPAAPRGSGRNPTCPRLLLEPSRRGQTQRPGRPGTPGGGSAAGCPHDAGCTLVLGAGIAYPAVLCPGADTCRERSFPCARLTRHPPSRFCINLRRRKLRRRPRLWRTLRV